jgi:hypothetical protein
MAAPTIEWVRPGVGFVAPAAASFRRLEDDLDRRVDVNSTYRDYGKQMGMFNAWNRYVASGRKPSLKPPHSQAIHPDRSMHCKGLALDSDDWTTHGFIALAAEHGWIRTAASDPTERHHFEYQAARDKHRNRIAPASAGGTPITPEDDMNGEQDTRLKNVETQAQAAHTMAERAVIVGYQLGEKLDLLKMIALTGKTASELAVQEGYKINSALATLNRAGVIDTKALAAEILKALPVSSGATFDLGELVAAVDKALEDNFADLPAEIRAEIIAPAANQ